MTELSSTCEAITQTPSEERLVALLDQWSLQWTWRVRQRASERYCTLGSMLFEAMLRRVEGFLVGNSVHRGQPFHATSLSTWNLDFHRRLARIGLHRDVQNMVGKTEPAIILNFQWR